MKTVTVIFLRPYCDRPWFNENSPKLKKPKSSVDRVDWNLRDTEVLAQVKELNLRGEEVQTRLFNFARRSSKLSRLRR